MPPDSTSASPKTAPSAKGSATRFDRNTWRRFVMLTKLFFTSEQRFKAFGLLLLLVAFALTINAGINVLLSFVGRDFINALSLRDKEGFYRELFYYLGAFAIAVPVIVFYRYTEERLGLFWRRWLSLTMLKSYLNRRVYYEMNWDGGIDNPDQRIEEDIRTFTAQTLSFFLILLNSLITLYAFLGILFHISPLLTVVVVAYAITGSLCAYYLGRPLIGLNFNQLKRDADYRYKLINLRDNAESIALYEGEAKEFTRTRQRLKAALSNLLQIINRGRNLNFFTTGYNFLVGIIPTIIVAPLYLDGKIEFGDISQSSTAFLQVLGALSFIVANFQAISGLAAVITRLGSFYEKTHLLAQRGQGESVERVKRERSLGITFDGVTIRTPRQGKVLVRDLNFTLESGGLIISGASGGGKSSILRTLAGLWVEGSGTIYSPERSEIFFIPQRPYMILGSLRAQILYGTKRHAVTDDEIKKVIDRVRLSEMLDRVGGLDVIQDWPNFLASGEQQKIAFARLLLARPRVALLDEATSSLDPVNEQYLYDLLRTEVKLFISVGHRALLSKYHEYHLELKGNGLWLLEKTAKD